MDYASALAEECTQAIKGGVGYGTVWDTIIRENKMVASPPIEHFDDDATHTDVLLSNGFWLRYCPDSKDFTLRRPRLHRPF
jgi:hypothetical protein